MKKGWKVFLIILLVLAILFAGVVVVFKTGWWIPMYYQAKCISYTVQNKSADSGRVVFLGDSITDFCDLEQFYPDIPSYNRGISADTTQGVLDRMDKSVFDLAPSVVVLLIGINDLQNEQTPENVLQNYEQILQQIRETLPNTKIITQSIYPVGGQYTALAGAKIMPTNEGIQALSEQYGCTYVDVYSTLVTEEGTFNTAYTDDDLHPNDAGYEVINDILDPVIKAAME